MKPNEYVIENVADLVSVPEHCWDAMLADLREWMKLRATMAAELADFIEAGQVELPRRLIWIDDGKPGLSKLRLIPMAEPGEVG